MLFAVYGSPKSQYGSIQYGQASPPIQNYGGWPDTHPNIQDEPFIPAEVPAAPFDTLPPATEHAPAAEQIALRIAENIAIIKRLRAELEVTHEIERRRLLRKQIDEARKEKERQFRLRAMIDDEETAFILFQ